MARITRNPPGPIADDYQAESDAQTLSRANEIKSSPQRHSKAKKHARAKGKALMAVAGDGKKSAPPMFLNR